MGTETVDNNLETYMKFIEESIEGYFYYDSVTNGSAVCFVTYDEKDRWMYSLDGTKWFGFKTAKARKLFGKLGLSIQDITSELKHTVFMQIMYNYTQISKAADMLGDAVLAEVQVKFHEMRKALTDSMVLDESGDLDMKKAKSMSKKISGAGGGGILH